MDAATGYWILGLLWIAWCSAHSLMISLPFTNYLKNKFGDKFRFYRVFFNTTALITIIPILYFEHSLRIEPVFSWAGHVLILRIALLIISAYLFYAGAKIYNISQFLGISQILSGNYTNTLSDIEEFKVSGILHITRHPWYLASIIIIWLTPLDIARLITNVILTSYLIIGTILEERKLISEFDQQYREYRKHVSMLFPWKYLKGGFKNKTD